MPNGVPNGAPKGAADPDCLPEEELPLEFRHWLTMGIVAALILSVIFFEVNVGMGAFVGAVILVLARAADDTAAIKAMPWGVIIMVCGVTVLIALLEKTQGIELLVSLIARMSTAESVTAVVALITGLVSVYASTSGVVLPAFLPVVPGLALTLGRCRCVRDCPVDERRRAPGRRLAGVDHRSALHRLGCSGHRHAQAVQPDAGVGPLDERRRRRRLLRVVRMNRT